MGAFEPPPEQHYVQQRKQQQDALGTSDSSPPSTPQSGDDAAGARGHKDIAAAGDGVVEAAAASGKAAAASGQLTKGAKGKSAGRAVAPTRKHRMLHLYAVAAPGMRRVPTSTRDIAQALSWGAPVQLKRRWTKVQKGYFDAPGEPVAGKAGSVYSSDEVVCC